MLPDSKQEFSLKREHNFLWCMSNLQNQTLLMSPQEKVIQWLRTRKKNTRKPQSLGQMQPDTNNNTVSDNADIELPTKVKMSIMQTF